MTVHAMVRQFPQTWPLVPLGELADHRLGKMLDRAKNTGVPRPYLRNPNIRWFDVDLADLQEILVEEKDIYKYELRAGDVLICEGGEAGRAALWKGEAEGVIFQKACHRVRVGPRLDPRFLVHRLMYDYFNGGLDDYYTGATIKHLTGQDLARYEIPLPPLNEQRRIAAILDKADALRRKRKRALDLLGSLSQSIFRRLFVESHSATWLERSIDDLADDIRTGPFGSQLLHSEFVSDGIAVLGIDNAVTNEFRWNERRYITEEKYKLLKRYTVRPNDVLITIMGTCGRCAIVPDDIPLSINTKHLCCITLKRDQCLPEFLQAAFLQHPSALRQLGLEAKGAVMPGLNMGIIKSIVLPLPPMELQEAFARMLSMIREQLHSMRKMEEAAVALFCSLQDRAFAGELR